MNATNFQKKPLRKVCADRTVRLLRPKTRRLTEGRVTAHREDLPARDRGSTRPRTAVIRTSPLRSIMREEDSDTRIHRPDMQGREPVPHRMLTGQLTPLPGAIIIRTSPLRSIMQEESPDTRMRRPDMRDRGPVPHRMLMGRLTPPPGAIITRTSPLRSIMREEDPDTRMRRPDMRGRGPVPHRITAIPYRTVRNVTAPPHFCGGAALSRRTSSKKRIPLGIRFFSYAFLFFSEEGFS